MKQILKSLYMHSSFITRPLFGGTGHILMLHRVCPPQQGPRINANAGMEMTPDRLETIIRFFSCRDYAFISLDQLAEQLQGKKIQKKFVLFTFDDGYTDNLVHAYPVFKKYQVPFTVYVTTGFPDRQAILWWYIVEDILLENRRISIDAGGEVREFNCSSPGEKEDAFFQIRSLIMSVPAKDYPDTIKDILDPFGIDFYKKTAELALSWGQIKQLSQDPLVTIGAHTVNHYALSTLPAEEAKKEILESHGSIEAHLNKKVEHFAYPYGGREEAGRREFDMVKAMGFKTAVTTRFANIFPQHGNHLECLPRIFVHGGADEHFFEQVINGVLPGMANKFKRVVTA